MSSSSSSSCLDRVKAVVRAHTKEWWHRSFWVDWSLNVAMAATALIVLIAVAPHERFIPSGETNPTYGYPAGGANTFPGWSLAFFEGVVPFIVLLVTQAFVRSWEDVHGFAIALLSALAYSVVWDIIPLKFVGRPRPNFWATQNNPDAQALAGAKYDDRQSYPSGHATTATASMVVVSLYVAGKIRLFARRSWGGRGYQLFLVQTPLLLAMFISVSRARDYFHGFADINAGMAFGALCGLMGYFLYYPSLFDEDAHVPRRRRDSLLDEDKEQADNDKEEEKEEKEEKAREAEEVEVEMEQP